MRVRLSGTGGPEGWPSPGCRCASCGRVPPGHRRPAEIVVDDRLRLTPPAPGATPDAPAGSHRAGLAPHHVPHAASDEVPHTSVHAILGLHGAPGRASSLTVTGTADGWTVTAADGARLLYAFAEDTRSGGSAPPCDLVLIDVLDRPWRLGDLRRRGVAHERTVIVAVGVDHRVPSEAELTRRLAMWDVLAVPDGTVLEVRPGAVGTPEPPGDEESDRLTAAALPKTLTQEPLGDEDRDRRIAAALPEALTQEPPGDEDRDRRIAAALPEVPTQGPPGDGEPRPHSAVPPESRADATATAVPTPAGRSGGSAQYPVGRAPAGRYLADRVTPPARVPVAEPLVGQGGYGRPRRTLLLGGSGSGKSAEAELRLAGEPEVVYVATGPSGDDDAEWRARVRAHRRRRPAHWRTVETADVAGLLLDGTAPLLVDGLGTWLAAVFDDCDAWESAAGREGVARRCDELVDAWRRTARRVVAVSDEVGLGVVPASASGRRFRDELGRLNQRLAAESEEVALVVAGRPLPLPI